MGRDKALLAYGESTFLGDLISTFRRVCAPVVVVLGHNAEKIAETIGYTDISVVVNRNYDLGMLSSLQTGLRAIPAEAAGALFTLVDHPGVRVATLRAIADALAAGPRVVIPRYRGERGHPVGIAREVIGELLALDPAASPQDVIRGLRAQTAFVDLDDPAITRDIDLPEEYSVIS